MNRQYVFTHHIDVRNEIASSLSIGFPTIEANYPNTVFVRFFPQIHEGNPNDHLDYFGMDKDDAVEFAMELLRICTETPLEADKR
jgi:hypothetical protein